MKVFASSHGQHQATESRCDEHPDCLDGSDEAVCQYPGAAVRDRNALGGRLLQPVR